jgi:HK97 family phage portal protein
MELTLPWRRNRRASAIARQVPEAATKSAYGPIGFAFHAPGDPAWTAPDYASLARQGYLRNPIAYRCVRMIAETCAAVPWLLHEGRSELTGHPLIALLARPNRAESGQAFLETLIGHLLLAGSAHVALSEAPGAGPAMHMLRPDRLTQLIGDDGWIQGHEYRAGSRKLRFTVARAGIFDGVLTITLFHPLDDHAGFAPVQAALMALDTHNATSVWNKALLDNSARPSGAMVYAPKDGGNLTDEQFSRLKLELEEGYGGPAKAGRPLLLEGGLDWKPMGLSPKDMDFLSAKHAAARDIALAFGVPPVLLGIPGDATYSNFSEANRAFHRSTILPLLARLAAEFNSIVTPRFGDGLVLSHDLDRVEGLHAEREALWARISAATFLTDDEKREALGYGRRPANDTRGANHG